MIYSSVTLRRLLAVLLLATPLTLPVVLVSAVPALAGLRGDDYPLRDDPHVCPPEGAKCTNDEMHNFYIRECTSFVAWRLQEVNHYNLMGPIPPGAKGWGTAYASITDFHPARGSVAWFRGGENGHVAWVADVIGSDVVVEEYNWRKNKKVPPHVYASRTVPASSFSGFIHFKDLDPSPPASGSQAPLIVSTSTYQEGVLVYARTNYTDVNDDAEGFGFRWWPGRESHPFSSPSYGRVSPGRVDYPFNLACDQPNQYAVDVQMWIYDKGGLKSRPATVHLECRGGT